MSKRPQQVQSPEGARPSERMRVSHSENACAACSRSAPTEEWTSFHRKLLQATLEDRADRGDAQILMTQHWFDLAIGSRVCGLDNKQCALAHVTPTCAWCHQRTHGGGTWRRMSSTLAKVAGGTEFETLAAGCYLCERAGCAHSKLRAITRTSTPTKARVSLQSEGNECTPPTKKPRIALQELECPTNKQQQRPVPRTCAVDCTHIILRREFKTIRSSKEAGLATKVFREKGAIKSGSEIVAGDTLCQACRMVLYHAQPAEDADHCALFHSLGSWAHRGNRTHIVGQQAHAMTAWVREEADS
eukprot:TRINITY_DN2161_c0_g2_i4.p1 TRINITY_DN2161_c0_g2~~TRINITY_DN2161_c0_g2_i4.p1  ORF type:complete len:302 (+),score=24.97 TRINITY_DN2161_c0_g2_i4:307-1212(+)